MRIRRAVFIVHLSRIAIVVMLMFVVGILAVPHETVHAQSPTTTTYDFSSGAQGWSNWPNAVGGDGGVYSTLTGGVWLSNCMYNSTADASYHYVRLQRPLPTPNGLRLLHVTVNYENEFISVSAGANSDGEGFGEIDAPTSFYYFPTSQSGTGLSRSVSGDVHIDAGQTLVIGVVGYKWNGSSDCGGLGDAYHVSISSIELEYEEEVGPPPGEGGPPALALYTNCPLLGIDNANFRSLPGNWILTGDAEQKEGGITGLQLLHGTAALTLMLSPDHQYSIIANYSNSTSELLAFRIGLGAGSMQTVTVNPLSIGTYTSPPANYNAGSPDIPVESETFADSFFTDAIGPTQPTAGFYTLLIGGVPESYELPEDQQPLTIDSVCVKDTTPGAVNGGTGGPSATTVPADCTAGCAFTLNGLAVSSVLDLPGALGKILEGLINYLLCGLLKWFRCVLAPALGGVWTTIQTIFLYINIARAWFGLVFQNGSDWIAVVLHVIMQYLGATLGNILQTILNAAYNVINSLGLVNIFNSVLSFFQSLFSGDGNVLGFIGTVIQALGTILSAVFDFLTNVLLARIVDLIQTIISIFASVIGALNAPAVAPPGVPACDTSASMIPASCVGLFIVDNSVLADGSVLWTVLPLIQGAAGLGVIWWAVNRVKKGFASADVE